MAIEENLQASSNEENKEIPGETSTATGSENPALGEESELTQQEEDIDLNHVFPEEENDLNELFPELEMKNLLKKVQKNKKDLNTMRDRFSEGI